MKACRYFLFAIWLSACAGPSAKEPEKVAPKTFNVVSRAATELRSLNPITGTGEPKSFIEYHMFQSLITIDFRTLDVIPLLAIELPVVEPKDGLLMISYEIRPEARWDNGDPITGHDVAFTLKVIKNPRVDAEFQRGYFEFIRDIIIDQSNPRVFTLVCQDAYMLSDIASGSYPIIPEYVYDPSGMMKNFTVRSLTEKADSLINVSAIRDFALLFNGPEFKDDICTGSGPYQFERWERNARVILRKKENWWGSALEEVNHWFHGYPEQIISELIKDDATALTSLKGGTLDVMAEIPIKDFVEELPNSEAFIRNFNTLTPPKIQYEYIGFNLRKPIFGSVLTRIALAHLVDVDKIISTVYYGLGEKTIGYVHPSLKTFYNERLAPYLFNLEQAKQILEKDGWKDTNGNGTLDKLISGKRTEFVFSLLYNTENERRAKVALMFKENARQAGIDINLEALEYSAYVGRMGDFDFDMMIRGVGTLPYEPDPKQSWHTSSAQKGGSNYVGFGNEETDKIIDLLRFTKDVEQRANLHKALQQVIYNQVPCIFLNTYKNTIAVSKKFTNVFGSAIKPGFWDSGFELAETVAP